MSKKLYLDAETKGKKHTAYIMPGGKIHTETKIIFDTEDEYREYVSTIDWINYDTCYKMPPFELEEKIWMN